MKNSKSARKPGVEADPLEPRPLDLTKAVRGKYYERLLKEGSNIVLLDPDLLDSFPDSPSVNRALRAFLAINHQIQEAGTHTRNRRRPAASAAPDIDPRVGIQARRVTR
jgi:hypothetical protein